MLTILAQSLMTAARQNDTTVPRWNAPRHWQKPPETTDTDRRNKDD